MNKATPKSCSCGVCRANRGTNAQHKREQHEERAFRHHQNELARQIAVRGEGYGQGLVPAGTRSTAA